MILNTETGPVYCPGCMAVAQWGTERVKRSWATDDFALRRTAQWRNEPETKSISD
jgi:hypothetical protein